jgi:hypothetical protein
MKTYKSPIVEVIAWETGTLCDSQIFSTSGANNGQQIGKTTAPKRNVF